MAAPSSSAPSSSKALLRHPIACPSRRPPADDCVNSWILEFVLRQPIPDALVNEIFLSLPFSSPELHPHLRKTLLLRRLSSDLSRRSISERTLHSLELIEELDRIGGRGPSNRMKVAYCAAAVECASSAYRRDGGDFNDAVERIWMTRIFNLMRSEAAAGLVSVPLVQWWERMGYCLSSKDGREKLLKKNVENTMRLVKDYVDEAMEEMGPSFLEIAAAVFLKNRMDLDVVANKASKNVIEVNGCLGKMAENVKELEDNDVGEKRVAFAGVSVGALEEGEVQNRSGRSADTLMNLGKDNTIVEGSSQEFVEVEVEDKRRKENVNEHDKTNHSECLSHRVGSNEVSKVKKALKKSCFDLNMMVEDPLPEAQAVAAAVLASMSHDHSRAGSLDDGKVKVNGKSSDVNILEGNHVGKECDKDVGTSKGLHIVSCGTIFEKNPTAGTRELSDDSLDSPENSPVPTDNLHSPNPMTKRTCLPRVDTGKFVRRRTVKRWTSREEDKLREAVAKYGIGNWKLILNSNSKIFEERTEVDLKDKWRNISRHL